MGSDFEAYSNLEKVLQPQAEARIRAGKIGRHVGDEFQGFISFDGQRFVEQVVRQGYEVEKFSASTLQGVIDKVNVRFGNE